MPGMQNRFEQLAEGAGSLEKPVMCCLFMTMADVFDSERDDEPVERYEDEYERRLVALRPLCDATEQRLIDAAIRILDGEWPVRIGENA